LLQQLQLSDTAFFWSRNPANRCLSGFAFYSFDNGFGFLSDGEAIVYDHDQKKVVYSSGQGFEKGGLRCGKAYLQMMYEEYLGN